MNNICAEKHVNVKATRTNCCRDICINTCMLMRDMLVNAVSTEQNFPCARNLWRHLYIESAHVFFMVDSLAPWASYQIRKIVGCACTGNAGFLRHLLQRKPLVSDPGKQHGTCVTHVPRCMSGHLTRGGGENFSAFPVHAQPAILRIWSTVHLWVAI